MDQYNKILSGIKLSNLIIEEKIPLSSLKDIIKQKNVLVESLSNEHKIFLFFVSEEKLINFKSDKLHNIIGFDALIYDVIPLFPALNIFSNIEFKTFKKSNLIEKVFQENRESRVASSNFIEQYCLLIILNLVRSILEERLSKGNEKQFNVLDKRLIDVLEYINLNLDKDLSNKILAEIALMAEEYVGQFFKFLTNKGLQDYIEGQRLKRAHELLSNTEMSAQEISYATGFRDPAYFNRRFTMKYGQTPGSVKSKQFNVI